MRILSVLAGILFLGCAPALAADAVPATSYFPVLPFDAPSEAVPQLVAVAANHALDEVHRGVTGAVIVIHDDSRDAQSAVATLSALAGGLNASTLIVAPQFLLPSDIARFADHLPEKGRAFAAWPITGWSAGEDSVTVPGRKSISSFTVVDMLLMHLSDRNAFPDLRQIVVAGFGAGGNFTQRYAAFSVAAPVIAKQNIDLRFVVAGATSYLYLTPSRPMGGNKGFGVADAVACPGVNAFPYGLEKLTTYPRRVGANAAKLDYATRTVTYLDARASDPMPDGTCAATAQGVDGISRAANYRMYLHTLYGDVMDRTQTFAVAKAAKVDAVTLFGSACGMSSLFGDGLCPPSFGESP